MKQKFTEGQLRTQAMYFRFDKPGKFTKSDFIRGVIMGYCDGVLIWKETPKPLVPHGWERITYKRQRDGTFKASCGLVITAEEMKALKKDVFEHVKIVKKGNT